MNIKYLLQFVININMTGRLVAIMCERKGVMYDCISWINRNYKKLDTVYSKKYLFLVENFILEASENGT